MITQKDFPLQIKTKPHISFLGGELCLTNVVIHNLDKSSNMQTVENRLQYSFIFVPFFDDINLSSLNCIVCTYISKYE